jgi:D-tagatose-1,6-bisphosphate aldolase subunit GatZ/KbaZ
MAKARQLVRDCVQAGYTKIHLDASMPLGEERAHLPLDRQISAERAAELCLAAEQALDDSPGPTRLVYVIGTEVPPPGGSTEKEEQIEVTRVEDTLETIEVTRAAFHARRLEHAWDRVIAMVVQPGVEFGDDRLFEYERSRAAGLSRFIEGVPGLVYEAHSTDYQDRKALKRMVEDHFAILKVGPALTFAFREAVFALAMLENELLGEKEDPQRSGVIEALEAAMLHDPGYWKAYYRGDKAQSRLARKYSPSDRIRYYWAVPEVARALKRLLENLERRPIPASLISQFLPVQYGHLRQGIISSRPIDLIYDKVWETAQDYAWACRSS